jgi:hypothetical protein
MIIDLLSFPGKSLDGGTGIASKNSLNGRCCPVTHFQVHSSMDVPPSDGFKESQIAVSLRGGNRSGRKRLIPQVYNLVSK